MSSALRVGIVGAGVAGLAAARVLHEEGWEVVLWDKGRSVGGRVSVRRAGAFDFDHGAQYFTARDPRFIEVLRPLREEGLVAPWLGRIVAFGPAGRGNEGPVEVDPGVERLVGVPGMNALPKAMARGLDVRCDVRVARAEWVGRAGGSWRLWSEREELLGSYHALLVTTPPAQAAALLGDAPLGGAAQDVGMRCAWAVLLGFEQRYEVPFDGAFGNDERLAWMARNNSKPGRAVAESWVLHGLPVPGDPTHREQALRVMPELFEGRTGESLPAVAHADAHLWGYAGPVEQAALPAKPLRDAPCRLALAGDGYAGGRVEGAFVSGLEAGGWLAAL